MKLGSNLALPTGTLVDVHNLATAASAVLDLNGFNATVSGLQQSDTSGSAIVTSSAPGAVLAINTPSTVSATFAGAMTGNLSLVKSGPGSQTFSGKVDYQGDTTLNGGMLTFIGGAELQNVYANAGTLSLRSSPPVNGVSYGPWANGNFFEEGATVSAPDGFYVAGSLFGDAGSLNFGGGEIDGNVVGSGATMTLGGGLIEGNVSGYRGSITLSDPEIWGNVTGIGGTITFTGQPVINGSIIANGGSITLAGGALVDGTITANAGTITITSANVQPFAVITTGSGTVVVDFTGVSDYDFLNPYTTDLQMSGGAFVVTAAGSTTDSQGLDSLTLNAGASSIRINSTPSNSVLLSLGPITRQIGSVVNFTLPPGVPSPTNGIATTTANANFPGGQPTILGGYATVGDTWAVSTGDGTNPGLISGLATYIPVSSDFGTTTNIAGKDIDILGSNSTATASPVTVNSLRFNTGNATLSLASPLTVATGGIVVGSQSSGGTIQGGSITSGNGTDLIVIANGSGIFAINSVITDNGTTSIGLTKAGTGVYTTSAQSTYSGQTTLVAGTAVVQNSSIGGAPGNPDSGPFGRGPIVFNGGQLRAVSGGGISLANSVTFATDTTFPGATVQAALTFTGPISLANGDRTLTNNSTNDVVFAGPIDDGGNGYGIRFDGTGRTILSGANTYSGTTTITGGVVLANTPGGQSATGAGSVMVFTSGVLGGTGTISPSAGLSPSIMIEGGILTAGTGIDANSKPGKLTLTVGPQVSGGPVSPYPSGLFAKFNPNNLGNAGATIGGNNPTATADPAGAGANWDEVVMPWLNLTADSYNRVNLTTVAVNGYGTPNVFNAGGSYAWPVAVITRGLSGFYVNGSPVVGSNSPAPQASLQAVVASLMRLDPTGLVQATGASPSAFGVGVAPDPFNPSYEDVVITYSPAPEPSSVALLGASAGALLLRRRRAR